MSWPSAFDMQLYFHSLMCHDDCMRKKMVSTLHNYNCGMHVAWVAQLVVKSWNACTGAVALWSIET